MAPRLPRSHPLSSGRDPVAPRGALCTRAFPLPFPFLSIVFPLPFPCRCHCHSSAEPDRKLFLAGSGPCLFSSCSPCLSSRFSETPPSGGSTREPDRRLFLAGSGPCLSFCALSALPPAFSLVLPLTFPFLSIVFPCPSQCHSPSLSTALPPAFLSLFPLFSLAFRMDFPFVAPLPGLRFKVQGLGVRSMAPRLPGSHPQSSGRDPVAPRGALCSRF